uniref:MARVEL domain-containing protein n=2 Tax=Lygus hesperus TaxID=30085 RepID=A0A0K8SB11_LYGHE
MSHSVTITRTTTTSSSTAILVNTGFLRTAPGILKLFEVLIAGTCLFLALFYTYRRYPNDYSVYEFYLATITAVLVASGCLLISCLLSLSTASILTKTLFELVYHCVAFALTFAASLVFYFDVKNYRQNSILAGAVLGLILSILYLISSVFAFRSYRGL